MVRTSFNSPFVIMELSPKARSVSLSTETILFLF
jgi:hypothetical protein